MRLVKILMALALVGLFGLSSVQAQDSEQEIIDRYLQKTVAKHTKKIGWASVNFSVDRINRHNDYNDFTILESAKLSNGDFSWIKEGFSLGADFGYLFKERFAWSIGGEYWLKMGETLAENDTYLQLSTMTAVPANPKSELQLYGVTTSFHYYLLNPPKPAVPLQGLSARVNATVGYYAVNWELWQQYENLNLSTEAPVNANTDYKGSAPGFALGLGADYPLGLWDLGIGFDVNYLYLNFTNVAWYNEAGDEIVASLDGTPDERVDLSFSGVRGKFEIKRFFSW